MKDKANDDESDDADSVDDGSGPHEDLIVKGQSSQAIVARWEDTKTVADYVQDDEENGDDECKDPISFPIIHWQFQVWDLDQHKLDQWADAETHDTCGGNVVHWPHQNLGDEISRIVDVVAYDRSGQEHDRIHPE